MRIGYSWASKAIVNFTKDEVTLNDLEIEEK